MNRICRFSSNLTVGTLPWRYKYVTISKCFEKTIPVHCENHTEHTHTHTHTHNMGNAACVIIQHLEMYGNHCDWKANTRKYIFLVHGCIYLSILSDLLFVLLVLTNTPLSLQQMSRWSRHHIILQNVNSRKKTRTAEWRIVRSGKNAKLTIWSPVFKNHLRYQRKRIGSHFKKIDRLMLNK